jgi:hypothetical protein
MVFPGIADTADGFAETNGEVNDRLQPLRLDGAQPVLVREQQLGIAKNSYQRPTTIP